MVFKKGLSPAKHKEKCQCIRCDANSPYKPSKLRKYNKYICDEYLSGRTKADIAKELKVCPGAIQRKLSNNKIKCRPKGFQRGMKKFGNGKDWGYQNKGRKLSEDHIKKALRRHPKSSLEIKFEEIINKHNIPYKFVGNGEVIIGRKCPDFVNTNGQKIAIEVFNTRHKLRIGQAKNRTIEGWQEERSEIFAEYGWSIEFFNEIEVNEKEILRRIG